MFTGYSSSIGKSSKIFVGKMHFWGPNIVLLKKYEKDIFQFENEISNTFN